MNYIKSLNSTYTKLLFCVLILSSVCYSCDLLKTGVQNHVYWVNSFKTPCQGVAPMQCLLVSKTDSFPKNNNWEFFYSQINGFEYQSGFIYKLLVNEEHIAKHLVPADASSIKYTLVKILKKEKVYNNKGIDGVWDLSSMNNIKMSGSNISLFLDTKSHRMSGNDSCNKISGKLLLSGDNKISFGMILSTKMMCQNMQLSYSFNKALADVYKYEIVSNELYLYNKNNYEILVFIKKSL